MAEQNQPVELPSPPPPPPRCPANQTPMQRRRSSRSTHLLGARSPAKVVGNVASFGGELWGKTRRVYLALGLRCYCHLRCLLMFGAGLLECSNLSLPWPDLFGMGRLGSSKIELLIRSKNATEGGRGVAKGNASLCASARERQMPGEKNTQQGHPGPLGHCLCPGFRCRSVGLSQRFANRRVEAKGFEANRRGRRQFRGRNGFLLKAPARRLVQDRAGMQISEKGVGW